MEEVVRRRRDGGEMEEGGWGGRDGRISQKSTLVCKMVLYTYDNNY